MTVWYIAVCTLWISPSVEGPSLWINAGSQIVCWNAAVTATPDH